MKLVLHNYWRSSASHRVRIALALKGLEYEYVAVNIVKDAQFTNTYRGKNPSSQVPTLDVIEDECLVARAVVVGDRIREQMHAWQQRWPAIGDVRGLGAMLAIELVRDPDSKEPAPELAAEVIDAALARGVVLLKAGVHGNCIRVLCPLTIEEPVLDEALAAWEDALAAVLS